MKQGDICLTSLQQADGETKLRPVLLITKLPGYGDWLVCGISSQLNKLVDDWDVLLEKEDPTFKETGLKKSSIVRLSFIASIPSVSITGHIGCISTSLLTEVKKRMCNHIRK